MHEALAQIVKRGPAAAGRTTVLRELTPGAPRLVEPPHVLYVGSQAGSDGVMLLAAYRSAPVLTVMDGRNGLAAGAVLAFVLREGRVRFEASLPAAQSRGLRLSSRLLSVASRVVEASS